ncbi:MAG: TIGR03915 family putative DNA repair protein, partial [Sedimentibacter sp.]
KVLPINQLYIKVSREEHKFIGILRFAELGGILYSKFSPDNDLILLLVEHFADRYKYEKFIIHDERRNKAVFYANGLWEVKENINFENIEYKQDEIKFQNLWKQYFTHIAIDVRTNTNLQFQFVPARYRKNMIEFK